MSLNVGEGIVKPYKPTLFDRHGPDAVHMLKAIGYGALACVVTLPIFLAVSGSLHLFMFARIVWVLVCSGASGALAALGSLGTGASAGRAWDYVMVEGSRTPYTAQFSQQQALIMQGKVDEALASFEAIIIESPDRIDVRLRAAELCAGEARNPRRAAELFRAVQGIPQVPIGDDMYATHRLVDLLAGPLGARGQAMAELRKLIDRYPASTGATHARDALARLKSEGSEAV